MNTSRRSPAQAVVVALALTLLAACGGRDDAPPPPPPPSEGSATVGAAGGTVPGPDGVQLIVPANALANPVTLRIARDGTGAPLLAGLNALSPIYAVTPHGLTFDAGAVLSIPLSTAQVPAGATPVLLKAEPGGAWRAMKNGSSDPARLAADIDSLSFFVIGACSSIPTDMWNIGGVDCPTGHELRLTMFDENNQQVPVPRGPNGVAQPLWTVVDTMQTRSFVVSWTRPAGTNRTDAVSVFGKSGGFNSAFASSLNPASVQENANVSRTFTVSIDPARVAGAAGPNGRVLRVAAEAAYTATAFRIGQGNVQVGFFFDTDIPILVRSSGPTPVINTQPANLGVTEGQLASFTVQASVTPAATLTYQWSRRADANATFAPIAGTTSATYTIAATALADNGAQFQAQVCAAPTRCVTSNLATLTVTQASIAPSFTLQPASASVVPGQTASFSVTAIGTPAPRIDWESAPSGSSTFAAVTGVAGCARTDPPASGTSTAASCTVGPLAVGNSGQRYRAVASNSGGSATSNAATLTVNPAPVPPTITQQPAPQTTAVGGSATFSVAATGTAPLYTTWRLNGVAFPAMNGAFTIGACTGSLAYNNNTTVTLSNLSAGCNGARITVVVSNGINPDDISIGATLTVSSSALDNWVTNGAVRAVALSADNSTLYLGGDFTQVGPRTGSFVSIDGVTGAVVAGFPLVNGQVFASAPDGAGGWYIGGRFSLVGSSARNNVARILANGSVDPNFNPNANDTVLTLAVAGGVVYAGGSFTSIGGLNRNRIAALDATTGAASTAWNPQSNGNVFSLAVSDTTVYAGGDFTVIGGQSRLSIASLDAASGSTGAWNPGANAMVRTLAVSGSTVYAGGSFTSIGGQTRRFIAAIDAAGAATTWNPNADAAALSIAVAGSTVYAGGGFRNIGGQARNFIAAIDATSGAASSWNPDANDVVNIVTLSGSTVYAGGDFATIGGQSRNHIAAIDAASGSASGWNPSANASPWTIAISGNVVYAGGYLTSIGGQRRSRIAAVDAATGTLRAWNPNADGTVASLAVSGATVYAGGLFRTIGGQARMHIAALDETSGLASAWNPNPNSDGFVHTITVSGNVVYAGGNFTTIGGQARNAIAALDAGSGLATAWNPNAAGIADTRVFALAVSGSVVYAGGSFSAIGGQTRRFIAALDAATGSATAWNPNADSDVHSVVVSGGTVYAGGYFRNIGGQTRNAIAALDAATGLASPWNPDPVFGSGVFAIAVSGGVVYAGGEFPGIGGNIRNNIAALDAATGLATAWNPNADGAVLCLAVSNNLYAGGDFIAIDGQARSHLAFLRI